MIHEHLHLLKYITLYFFKLSEKIAKRESFESTLRLTYQIKKKNGSHKQWFQSINIIFVIFCERLYDPKFLDFYHLCDTDLPTS